MLSDSKFNAWVKYVDTLNVNNPEEPKLLISTLSKYIFEGDLLTMAKSTEGANKNPLFSSWVNDCDLNASIRRSRCGGNSCGGESEDTYETSCRETTVCTSGDVAEQREVC
ncbi:uncharacterized protein PITG_11992 [Phytophthora infestans T30-4]|uniref:Uncharacterized protein n=1 Tax=Phytophthora infestans (strain T30-4) TaxID=403677 RepID=D0NHP9_PHYIT|nr:uncharacterized protein PITG_11992 [Phytophthora infestans T30-4]EEY58974.1 hypothetical protein PITG_11992 [Phytophthora infestans T30-4]|eukprot:XP_002901447.1 hypothetical protein PITG_11992 [Phytophthora infestans T30-4]